MSNEKKETKVDCISCNQLLSTDHTGIKCLQNHHICVECVPLYLQYVFESPELLIPPKCQVCSTEIPEANFESQLTGDVLAMFLNYIYMKKLQPDEKISSCPFCQYFEIWPKKSDMNFFYCKNPKCEKGSCSICHKEFSAEEKYDDNGLYYEVDDEESMMAHFKCTEMAPLKERFEQVLSNGEKMFCPGCGVGGRKDDNCTHMTCVSCQTKWCYFCGLSETDCDKEVGKNDIFGHNVDWKNNEKRCPMYLTVIEEVDFRWGDSEDECLAFFHRLRTLRLLKEFITEIGVQNFVRLGKQFLSVKQCGYTIEEIFDEDQTLILRGGSD